MGVGVAATGVAAGEGVAVAVAVGVTPALAAGELPPLTTAKTAPTPITSVTRAAAAATIARFRGLAASHALMRTDATGLEFPGNRGREWHGSVIHLSPAGVALPRPERRQ